MFPGSALTVAKPVADDVSRKALFQFSLSSGSQVVPQPWPFLYTGIVNRMKKYVSEGGIRPA